MGAVLGSDAFISELKHEYGDRRSSDFDGEYKLVQQCFNLLKQALANDYDIEHVLAVGGTSILVLGKHKRLHQKAVIKFNRPHADGIALRVLENESLYLPRLSHPNIVPVLDCGKLTLDNNSICAYLIEPFIGNAMPLFTAEPNRTGDTWLGKRLDVLRNNMPAQDKMVANAASTVEAITILLREVTGIIAQLTQTLSYIHSLTSDVGIGFVHLDIKGDNVLIANDLRLTCIDFGSITALDPQDHTPINVSSTKGYAHPELRKQIDKQSASNRVVIGTKRSSLRSAFDHYALGMSVLEILDQIASIRPHLIPQLPLYRSIHFFATRLLDQRAEEHPRSFKYATEIFPGLRKADYTNLAYDNMGEAFRDIEKERGHWNLEEKVPELATYSKDIVRVVSGFNTVLTPRLRRIIEHPLVRRLKFVTQLGLVSLIYPTSDHSRYDHALGSYSYTTYYVKSLFNDLGNPVFRNLVGIEDVNAVLLAALLHDLGQYPLAHDLEEVHDTIFNHGRIGRQLFNDPMVDDQDRTLKQIIEDVANGWTIKVDSLLGILDGHSRTIDSRPGSQKLLPEFQSPSLKESVLAAIIDGQVDADKADYIIRDSASCKVPYGDQLDIERLLRVLTVAIIPPNGKSGNSPDDSIRSKVVLGVYDKGLASAHAFIQARYQLFSTVYWHHTSRVIKSMLQYATVIGLPEIVFINVDTELDRGKKLESENKVQEIRERLLHFIKSLVPPFGEAAATERKPGVKSKAPGNTLDLFEKPLDDVIAVVKDKASGGANVPDLDAWYPGVSWTDWLMLRWIGNLPSATLKSKMLISGLLSRKLYKRIVTLSRNGEHEALVLRLEKLEWLDRLHLCEELHKEVADRVSRQWGRLDTVKSISQKEFEELSSSQMLILIDIPSPKPGFKKPLGVVPELKEKSYQQETRNATEDTQWLSITTEMFKEITPVRILCHPDIRNYVSLAFKDESMEAVVAGFLKKKLGLEK